MYSSRIKGVTIYSLYLVYTGTAYDQ
jgi:hypothetical protein